MTTEEEYCGNCGTVMTNTKKIYGNCLVAEVFCSRKCCDRCIKECNFTQKVI